MKKSPLISVIVTAHNKPALLDKCLTALEQQTLQNIEIICLDDASSDDTPAVLRRHADHDARIRAIFQKQNRGVSATRNHGISLARAPYIMFCDGDDYYDPTMCAVMYEAVSQPNIDLAISEINIIYHAHREMKPSDDNYYSLRYAGRQQLSENVIFYTDLAPTNKIFKKSLIKQNHLAFPEGLRFEDAYFCVAYMCAGKMAFYVNQRLYNYVRHADSLMSSAWSQQDATDVAIDHLYIAFRLYDFLEQHELLTKFNQLYWRFFQAFLEFALINSKSKARVKQAKAEASDFIASHLASFNAVSPTIQEDLRRLTASRVHISSTRIKRILIRLMPTYRLATENIQRLRTLKVKNRELIERARKLGLEK